MMKDMIIQQHQQPMDENMSNLTSSSGQASVSSNQQPSFASPNPNPALKKKRNLPGNPDPDAEVIALSPKTLMATNRFVCEICNKGFQRDQNLQLHRRGHNLPWKLKQRTSKEVRKKVYICPEATCVHHDPSRALGDLTGIKKHFSRKHGEKKWKCDKCSKKYAVQSDWKAHSKICGTREYRCDCGTLFSRRDSFITHRAFCDALAEESARAITANPLANHHPALLFSQPTASHDPSSFQQTLLQSQFPHLVRAAEASSSIMSGHGLQQQQQQPQELQMKREHPQQQQQQQFSIRSEMPQWLASQQQGPASLNHSELPSSVYSTRTLEQEYSHDNPAQRPLPYQAMASSPHMSATALLQKAAQMGATMSRPSSMGQMVTHTSNAGLTTTTSAFGLGLTSANQEITGRTRAGGGGGGDGDFGQGSGPSPLLQDMMVNSLSSAQGYSGSFDDAFGGMLGTKREGNNNNSSIMENFMRRHGRTEERGQAAVGGGGGNDGMTRDFLGLRAFSHRDHILNLTGLDTCMSSSYEQPPLVHSKKPWQG